jgi:hypothetical protein
MTDKETIEALLAALDHEDADIRIEAIHQLGEMKASEAIPRLLELLKDDNGQVRLAAYEALQRIDERVIQELLDSLRDTTQTGASIDIPPEEALRILAERDARKMAGSAPPEPAHQDDLPEEFDEAVFELLDESAPAPAAEEPPKTAPPPPAPAMPAPAGPPPSAPEPQPAARARSRSESDSSSEPQAVQFSAYYPREVRPDEWQPLQAYVFKEFAADQVEADAEKQLGPLARFRRIVESARQRIGEGETITATPHLPGFQFNPPAISVGFFEDWHRFDFKMRAKDAPLHLAANGFLTFTVNGVIVADIPLSVFVTHDISQGKPQGTGPQPVYDTVFASYSHKDTLIVEKVEAGAKALGLNYLRDVITLRSGEDWNEGLIRMIDEATIFQMFWSVPYSQSPHCRQEWEYAVTLNREAARFIRPVYWLRPMPAPPAQLQHLHFTYQPDLVK